MNFEGFRELFWLSFWSQSPQKITAEFPRNDQILWLSRIRSAILLHFQFLVWHFPVCIHEYCPTYRNISDNFLCLLSHQAYNYFLCLLLLQLLAPTLTSYGLPESCCQEHILGDFLFHFFNGLWLLRTSFILYAESSTTPSLTSL